MLDDNRPVLTLTLPQEKQASPLDRILVGMADYYTGLDTASFSVATDFEVNGVKAGENLAPKFKEATQGVWELRLDKPLQGMAAANITVSVKDKQGNTRTIDRRFSVK